MEREIIFIRLEELGYSGATERERETDRQTRDRQRDREKEREKINFTITYK